MRGFGGLTLPASLYSAAWPWRPTACGINIKTVAPAGGANTRSFTFLFTAPKNARPELANGESGQLNMMKLKAVCCVCSKVYRDGPTLNGQVSHGFCEKCAAAELRKIKERK